MLLECADVLLVVAAVLIAGSFISAFGRTSYGRPHQVSTCRGNPTSTRRKRVAHA
jgi:hypothetical protein